MFKWEKVALFAVGTLFGSAGFKLLGSKDARKAYTQVTAAALRVKDSVMTTATQVQECSNDILADAKEINAARQQEEENEVIEDASASEQEEESAEDASAAK